MVGDCLWSIFFALGITPREDCHCKMLRKAMNSLGVKGCRANYDRILRMLNKTATHYDWCSYLKAGWRSLYLGWLFDLNLNDPISSLLSKAIDMTEEQECQTYHGHMV